jgi:hypothetical protein
VTLHGLSDRFLAAVRGTYKWAVKVQCWSPAGILLADLSDAVLSGSVSVDETAEIRRTLTMTLQGTEDLMPANLSDLLHPATGNELQVYRGVEYPDGTKEFAQLGVFRMTKPVIADDDTTPTITINGQDRASVIARIAWQKPYPILAGQFISEAIQAAMETRYPGLQFNFANIEFAFPNTTFGASMIAGSGSSSDPMSDLITFAATAGCELFFDVRGVATLRKIINPLTSEIADGVSFVEGESCTMTTVQRTLDESTAFNGVTLFCNGTGTVQPFSVQVWDTDPGSPTYYLGPWGQVPLIITTTTIPAQNDTFAVATIKAEQYAFSQLQLIVGSFDNVSLTAVPNPALREGDCVRVTRNRVKINNAYVISTMTIPLDPSSTMAVTFRPRIGVLSAL